MFWKEIPREEYMHLKLNKSHLNDWVRAQLVTHPAGGAAAAAEAAAGLTDR